MARMRTCFAVLLTMALLALPISAQAQKDDMDFEPEEISKSEPESPTLIRAKKLYDKGDHYSASIEFYKVVKGETQDSEGNKQKAEFFLGKTLYQMGFYAGSLAYFDQIVQKGGAHRYYPITLKWLAALSKVLPETAGILEKIGKYSRQDIEDPALDQVRPELYYLLGKQYYKQGQFEQAIELFGLVPQDSPWFIHAKFFEGVTYVRQNQGAPAVEAFKRILEIAQEPELRKPYKSEDIVFYAELANLSMARAFYSIGQYETAIRYYEKVSMDSPKWLESLSEASWAYFMRKTNSKALGNIHTLTAPYFQDQFFPEYVNLKAVIYFNYCLYDRAEETVTEFIATYPPLRDDLRKIMRMHPDDNAAFYEYVKKIRTGKAGLSAAAQRLAESALQSADLHKTFAWVDELERELKQYEKADRAWKTTAVAADALQELTVQKSLAEAEAGRVAREKLERLEGDINDQVKQARKIRYEILNAKANKIAAEYKAKRKGGKEKAEVILVDDEHQTWDFQGEYWKDELGFYRFRIADKCPKEK